MEENKEVVNVFLFSEMDEEDNITPLQYELNQMDCEELLICLEEGTPLIRFGNVFHNVDDIIKIVFVE